MNLTFCSLAALPLLQVLVWHSMLSTLYYIAGAVYSGTALLVIMLVLTRVIFRLENHVTPQHLETLNKIILATSLMVGVAYAIEFSIAWYSGNPLVAFAFVNRAFGPYWWVYWTILACSVFIPQLFWFKKIRTTPWVMVVICVFVSLAIRFEQCISIVTSLFRDFTPSTWAMFAPTRSEIGAYWLFRIVRCFVSAVL